MDAEDGVIGLGVGLEGAVEGCEEVEVRALIVVVVLLKVTLSFVLS